MKKSVYILAGGQSCRMGEDKAQTLFHGRALMQYSIMLARQLSNRIYILSNHKEHLQWGLPMLADRIPHIGAAGGIDAMLHHEEEGEKVLLSCDMPMVDYDSMCTLLELHETDGITVFQNENFLQPFPGVFSSKKASAWREGIMNQTYSLKKLLALCGAQGYEQNHVIDRNPYLYVNTNTKFDLLSLEKSTMTIQCFGKIRELTGAEIIVVEKSETESELRENVYKRFPTLRNETFAIAVNRKIITAGEPILPESEIALLPPFSGG